MQHAVLHGSRGEAGGLVSGGFVRGDAVEGIERNGDHGSGSGECVEVLLGDGFAIEASTAVIGVVEVYRAKVYEGIWGDSLHRAGQQNSKYGIVAAVVVAWIVRVIIETDHGSGIEFLRDDHVAKTMASLIDLAVGRAGEREAGGLSWQNSAPQRMVR
jgi:hypothetical protein